MSNNIAKFYHRATKITKREETEKADFENWPKEWKTIYFKEYPRFSKILLPKPESFDFSLKDSLVKRKSEREFNGEPVSLQKLSALLFYSAGIIEKEENDWNKTRRTYPSGGIRFPLEIYPIILNGMDELQEGVYHYNVKEHSLERLWKEKNLREKIYPKIIWQDMILSASALLVISVVFWRNMIKYKERGYRYILFEAGHLGQNIYLVSTALGLKSCAIGGFNDDKFNDFLDIDGEREAVIYPFAVGS